MDGTAGEWPDWFVYYNFLAGGRDEFVAMIVEVCFE